MNIKSKQDVVIHMMHTKKPVEIMDVQYDCDSSFLSYLINLTSIKYDLSLIRMPISLYRKLCLTEYVNSDGYFKSETGCIICISVFDCKAWNYETFILDDCELWFSGKDVRK